MTAFVEFNEGATPSSPLGVIVDPMGSKPRSQLRSGGQIFTCGQVAKICQVAPRTATKWADDGLLSSYRIPGSLDRRITREALAEFMAEHGIPGAEALGGPPTRGVLLVGFDPDDVARLGAEVEGVELHAVATSYAAGSRVRVLSPLVVAVDVSGLGRIEACQVAAGVAADAAEAGRRPPRLVAAAAVGEPAGPLLAAGFAAVVPASGLADELAKVAAP